MPKALAGRDTMHDPAVDRIVLGHHNRRGMRPGLEQAALIPEQGFQVLWLIGPNAAEDHELVARRDHVGRVELQEAKILDDIEDAIDAGFAGLTGQSLAGDRQPSGRRRQHAAHRRSLLKGWSRLGDPNPAPWFNETIALRRGYGDW